MGDLVVLGLEYTYTLVLVWFNLLDDLSNFFLITTSSRYYFFHGWKNYMLFMISLIGLLPKSLQ